MALRLTPSIAFRSEASSGPSATAPRAASSNVTAAAAPSVGPAVASATGSSGGACVPREHAGASTSASVHAAAWRIVMAAPLLVVVSLGLEGLRLEGLAADLDAQAALERVRLERVVLRLP